MQQQINAIKEFLLNFQAQTCDAFSNIDGTKNFISDAWKRPGGGGGITRVIDNGAVFERGGVNFSHIYGDKLPPAATKAHPHLTNTSFEALGVSIVMHPQNPNVPTSHFNVRFFVADKNGKTPIWWFGGGFDLTPYYGFEEDCVLWHQHANAACEILGTEYYPRYKKWCDDYFYLAHRQEARGIGGIFFDDLNEQDFAKCFSFIQAVAANYVVAYSKIVNKRKDIDFTEQQRQFQLYRRGRYVEFNLVYDRGTLFGLQSAGRTESILMSMPPLVRWEYCLELLDGSREAELYHKFLKPQQWLQLEPL